MALIHIATEKKLLFDGQDEGFYTFKYPFNIPHEVIIYERDFRKNYVNDLEKLMLPEAFQQLIREGYFYKHNGSLSNYVGSDGLTVNYFITGGFLFVFANGEFQPSRYKIYFEGAWQL